MRLPHAAPGRRGFLAGGALAAGAVLTGCGTGRTAGGSSVDTFTAVLQGSGTGEGIDPGLSHQFIDEARMKAVYDGLFEVDDRMVPVPRLAVSGEPNADGTRWRLRLRDARWHDGTAFGPADVLFTLSRILGPATTKPFVAANVLKDVDLKESREAGKHVVEIALKKPSFDFLTALAATGTRIVKNGTKDFTRPVGTGAFRFASFDAGKQFTATAYAHHWNGAPKIQRLKILSVEPDARVNALRGGQADYADELSAAAVRTLRGADGITVRTHPDAGFYYFAMKTDQAPFDEPDVRRALMRMIDRTQLVRVALEGQGEAGNDVFGKGYRYYAGDIPQHSYDPDAAAALLRKAGASGLAFDLFTAPVTNGFVEAAHLVAQQAKKSGVSVRVDVGSTDTYYTEALKRGALTMGQTGPYPVPNFFAERLLTGAPQNRSNWSDEEFDRLYAKAQATASEPARARIYHRMHEIVHARGGFVNWANGAWSSAAQTAYTGVPFGVPNTLNWARFDNVAR